MQREIKFRGKRIYNGEWEYGYIREVYGHTERMFVICPSNSFESDGFTDTEECLVYPETVGQFTGLKDKNGKEIYEGDILKNREECTYCVIFREGMFYASTIDRQRRMFGGFPLWFLLANVDTEEEYEIIGNIHDNPELLKTE